MTNHWIDIQRSDCILIMGSNAAENHPISFKWVLKAREKGAKIINVDPRFTRTSSQADVYTALRSGTDIAFLGGMIKYILDNDKYFHEYVDNYTNAAFIINDKFGVNDGIFSGYDSTTRKYDKSPGPINPMPPACLKKTRLFSIRSVCCSFSKNIIPVIPWRKSRPSPEHRKMI